MPTQVCQPPTLRTQFGVHGVLGAFLTLQASRVRFRFSDTDLDVVFIDPGADDATAAELGTESSGGAVQVGKQSTHSLKPPGFTPRSL
jgi:hypothetical protein